jgi:hypothetical protein
MINIRKLAAVDMAVNGTRFIVAEFAIGVVGPLLLGLLSLRAGLFSPVHSTWEWVLGLWLVTIGGNYIPLFIYAVLIARGGTVKEEGLPEVAHARRYGVQQVMILVPLMVVIVAILQEVRRK